jgi:hypothetical protein
MDVVEQWAGLIWSMGVKELKELLANVKWQYF